MFERNRWYPNIGFQQIHFLETLNSGSRPTCHNVFPGICDTDIARDVRRALIEQQGHPKLVYWLTLDSHLPVHPVLASYPERCTEGGVYETEDVCLVADLWQQVFSVVSDIARDPDLEPTNILVVGDHVPPFWKSVDRSQFVHDEVPWVYLQARQTNDLIDVANVR
jgi:phosphoglycerol transferase MdoB-like AlkP superfamily enzyme